MWLFVTNKIGIKSCVPYHTSSFEQTHVPVELTEISASFNSLRFVDENLPTANH